MKNKGVLIILISLFALNVLACIVVYDLNKQEFLEVTFFDVGQGDSIFIETPQGHQILLDGGPDLTILEKLEKEMSLFDKTIDLVILSHPDSDHITGLIEVLKRYKVKYVLWTGIEKDSSQLAEWNNLLKEEGAKVFIAKNNLRVSFGESSLNVLYPFESLEGESVDSTNNTSIVLKVVYGETSFLFTGDIYNEIEVDILKEGVNADVLKIAHHGSKTSTSEEFLLTVLPNTVVISCGEDNSYGHPHQETLDTLEKYGINIFRTDLNGDIKLISDKNKIYGVSDI